MSRVDVEKLESELQGLTIKEINDHPTKSREEIAFDLFVLASEKEQVGKLNDAADYYWKAFKLDDKVDLKYREKYFAAMEMEEGKQSSPKDKVMRVGNLKRHNVKPLELNRGRLIELLDSYSASEEGHSKAAQGVQGERGRRADAGGRAGGGSEESCGQLQQPQLAADLWRNVPHDTAGRGGDELRRPRGKVPVHRQVHDWKHGQVPPSQQASVGGSRVLRHGEPHALLVEPGEREGLCVQPGQVI
ncbi:hypothetical protein PMKS-003388 [Pichia membranifaciens]|uniref:Uncharacterized protein n=1 Tax=Pichia membranifaciens TaxID=4926 RepID=A0A1Q2YK14_9ASCO|nr:hypothetical protein PMKS-003388 [Pichia membranifaciens]